MEYHSGGSLPLLGRPRYCPGANANGGYLCETGHCCGETGCCTYYYELWWFWLLWTVLILFSCCCAYRHRRAKLRVQQQQRQREISLLAYHGANSFPSSMLDLSFLASLKLPSYEEVAAQPSTPPPPYSSVFTTPRYPQPPRAADPHLLTQHGPLLHQPLSDGPSSLSSDNSSSCSCDSCCPSSPCSSSLSAPITYETDTSHASTPSEATPLTHDVTMETIAAAASCLGSNETRLPSERTTATVVIEMEDGEAARAQEPNAKESSLPRQTVTTAVVTRATSPGVELTLPVATSPINLQVDTASRSPIISTASSSTLPSPSPNATQLPSIRVVRTESVSGPPTPTTSWAEGSTTTQTPENLSLTRTLNPVRVPCSPASAPPPELHRTLAFETTSDILLSQDQSLSLVVTPTTLSQTSVPTNLTQEPPLFDHTQSTDPAPSKLSPLSNPQTILDPDSIRNSIPTLKPAYLNLNQDTDEAPLSPSLVQRQNLQRSPGSGLIQITQSPSSGLIQITQSPGSGLVPISQSPGSGLVQTPQSPGSGVVQTPQSPGSDLVQTPQSPGSGLVPISQSPGSDLVPISQSPGSGLVPISQSPGSDLVQTPQSPGSGLVQTPQSPGSDLVPISQSPGSDLVPISQSPGSGLVQTPQSPGSGLVQIAQSPGSGLVQTPQSPGSGLVQTPQSPASGLVQTPCSPGSGLVQTPGSGLVQHSGVSCLELTSSAGGSESVLVPYKLSESNLSPALPSVVQAGFSPGSGSPSRSNPLSTLAPVLTCPTPEATSSSCPAITIEPEASRSPLAVLSPSSPRSPRSPRSPLSLVAPALLLDPLTALQPSDKGGSSSGHASSLSPSPRATQSPPKQTVFSPCVDIFEPGPPSWEDGEEEQDDKDNDEDEDDDMGADESQYRHRRLTGDSGIEVCRCRVEEEDDDEEEEKEDGNTGVHDSVDCPARGQMSTGDELSLCTPTAAVTSPTSDDSSKVVIVMEKV